jgi:cytochrome c oxidase subunit 2
MDRPMHQIGRRFAAVLGFLAASLMLASQAMAQVPRPWEIGMQPAAGPLKQHIIAVHDLVLVIITIITVFVAGMLLWVGYRYSARRNPVPSRVSHHTLLEVAWTVVPVLILVVIAIPSFRLVYYEDRTHDADLTVKVTAHQWYWEYSYPDQGNLDVESRIIPDDQLKPDQRNLRMLAVDNPMVVPAGKNIRILTTSADVIHSFFIPSLGVQRYAIPGRTIETWLRADRPGDYYGECNQICGQDHSRMPIAVHAVSPQEFDAWVKQAKSQQTSEATPKTAAPMTVAQVQQ